MNAVTYHSRVTADVKTCRNKQTEKQTDTAKPAKTMYPRSIDAGAFKNQSPYLSSILKNILFLQIL